MLLILLVKCAWACNAQVLKFVEALPDGSKVITLDGIEYRAITGDKAVELAKQKADLVACRADRTELSSQVNILNHTNELLKKDITIAEMMRDSFKTDFERAQADAKRNFGLFIGERELRVEAQQFIPHGNVNGFGGKILNFLDGGYGQSLFKLVIPTAQFIKVMRQ